MYLLLAHLRAVSLLSLSLLRHKIITILNRNCNNGAPRLCSGLNLSGVGELYTHNVYTVYGLRISCNFIFAYFMMTSDNMHSHSLFRVFHAHEFGVSASEKVVVLFREYRMKLIKRKGWKALERRVWRIHLPSIHEPTSNIQMVFALFRRISKNDLRMMAMAMTMASKIIQSA